MASTQFDGLLTTLLGYIIIAVSLACLHGLMSLLRFRKYAIFNTLLLAFIFDLFVLSQHWSIVFVFSVCFKLIIIVD